MGLLDGLFGGNTKPKKTKKTTKKTGGKTGEKGKKGGSAGNSNAATISIGGIKIGFGNTTGKKNQPSKKGKTEPQKKKGQKKPTGKKQNQTKSDPNRNIKKEAAGSSGYNVPERIWNFLCKERGLGAITTAAIMGNIAQESSYNPANVNPKSGAKGICQWHLTRSTALDNFAASEKKDWKDLETQLKFFWQEANQRGDIATTQNASKGLPESNKDEIYKKIDVECKAFCDCFERPGKKEANYQNRYNKAHEAYEKQGKGILAAGNYSPPADANGLTPGYLGQPSPAKRGASADKHDDEDHGHVDEYTVKPIDHDKTYCEPIYPDLTVVGDQIPPYSIPPGIPASAMTEKKDAGTGVGLVYSLSATQLAAYTGKNDMVAFNTQNQKIAEQRKQVFKAAEHRNSFKVPTAGRPPNITDPFPVDYKIEELETHQPRCKIESVEACRHSVDVAKAVVSLSTDVEKRIVRLENNMATILRYLYRLANRITINCVYYGGQTSNYQKYKCIRCLKDNRIYEGAEMSLDQCLNCTRYEPLIGQVYDIFNDSGISLSQIIDDNQMSFTTMDEYCKFSQVNERQMEMQSVEKMGAATVKNRNSVEIDFKDEWGPGLEMNWSLYPVELQKPHINKQQSLDERLEESLASSQGLNSGSALTGGSPDGNMLITARNQIDSISGSGVLGFNAKEAGSSFGTTEKADEIAAEVKGGLGEKIREAYQQKGITEGQDISLIASLMAVHGSDSTTVVNKFEEVKAELKEKSVTNIVLATICYEMNPPYLFGEPPDDSPPVFRLDKVWRYKVTGGEGEESPSQPEEKSADSETDANKDKSTDQNERKSLPAGQEYVMQSTWANVNKWNWNDFIEALHRNLEQLAENPLTEFNVDESLVNFAKVVYLYKELISKCSSSRFDTAEWGFPFTEEQCNSSELLLNHPKNGEYGNARTGHMHNGVDIGVGGGADWYGKENGVTKTKATEVHAAADGIVNWINTLEREKGAGGNCLGIEHANKYHSCYMHLSKIFVSVGQQVKRGEVIGLTGGTGKRGRVCHERAFDEHLHFEIRKPPGNMGDSIDPFSVYNGGLSSRERPFQFRNIKL